MIRSAHLDAAEGRASREYDAERIDPRLDVERVPPLMKVHASDGVSVTPGPNSIDREASRGIRVGGDRISLLKRNKKDDRATDASTGRGIGDISDHHGISWLHTSGNDGDCRRRSFRRDLGERATVLARRRLGHRATSHERANGPHDCAQTPHSFPQRNVFMPACAVADRMAWGARRRLPRAALRQAGRAPRPIPSPPRAQW